VKIYIDSSPEHICTEKEEHHDLFLDAFIGIELAATLDPDNELDYLVEVGTAIMGLMKKHGPISVPGVYWQMRWLRQRLTDHIRIPRDCCHLVEE